jgi:hypothetical protein
MSAKALRAAPAYSTYAADDLARTAWYGLSAGERGLLESMARVYWVEGRLPRDARLLALACRLPTDDVARLLTDGVLVHFEADPADPDVLHHVELRRQLQNIARIRESQSIGGKNGAALTNEARTAKRKPKPRAESQRAASTPAGQPARTPAGQVRVPERTEMKELKSTSSLGRSDTSVPDRWVADYSETEKQSGANAYRKASRGA